MPMYDFACLDGHRFERIVPLAQFGDKQHCDCGSLARRLVSAPMVISDCIDPKRGMDGKLHDSRKSFESATDEYGETWAPVDRDALEGSTAPAKIAKDTAGHKEAFEQAKAALDRGETFTPISLGDD